jgi:hypothetical protein
VAYERGEIKISPKPLFYSVKRDHNTQLSHKYLVQELIKETGASDASLYGEDATVARLGAALAETPAPRLVFTSSHGVEFPQDRNRWGALTDANYRGKPGNAVVSAEVAASFQHFGHGSIFFSFACFSAGVPEKSTLAFLARGGKEVISIGAQVSPLPRLLVGHSGGPVAYVGHVDRVTAVAFQSMWGKPGIEPYRNFALWLTHEGTTLGRALGELRVCTRTAGSKISAAFIEKAAKSGEDRSMKAVGRKWIGFHDYRGYLLLGDPALTVPKVSR